MRTRPYILLLILLATLCGACRHTPEHQAIYERYAAREELHVAYVEGFTKDSIHGDFIILSATDTATWVALAKEFGIPRSVAQVTNPNTTKSYISFCKDRKDPTQDPPMVTLPSGKQRVDIEQSCDIIVDIINQKIFLIFAKDEESFYTIGSLLSQ